MPNNDPTHPIFTELEPFTYDTSGYAPIPQFPDEESLREHLFDWYINSGFRGCLFNKSAAKKTRNGEFTWETPVEYAQIEDITMGEAGQQVLSKFEDLIGDGEKPGLVSYLFPALKDSEEYVALLEFLATSNPNRFRILPIEDREPAGIQTLGDSEYVGIPFRIKLGETAEGQEALASPMIYSPDSFTSFARRYDHFMITFNRFNAKTNPETPDTYVGVDDIDLDLSEHVFQSFMRRSLDVNLHAHADSGMPTPGEQFSRRLFRAHNSLVIPAQIWDQYFPDIEAPTAEERATEVGKTVLQGVPQTQEEVKKETSPKTVPTTQRSGHRGHPMRQVKEHLAQQGKLNSKPPMPDQWKKRRQKKRK
jgi:hypothetical protein